MADFFSRLVDRSLGLVSTIQPAIAPRFSSAPAIADEIDLQGNQSAPPLISRPSVLPAVTRSSDGLNPQVPVAAAQLSDGSPPQPNSAAPFSPSEPDKSRSPIQDHPAQKAFQPPRSIPASQPSPSLQPSASLPQSNSERLTLPSHSIAPAQSIAEVSSQTALPEPFRVVQPHNSRKRYPLQAIVQSAYELPDKSESISNPTLIQPIPSQEYSDRLTLSQSMPFAQPDASSNLPLTRPTAQILEESAASPPTIRVSIGRVEVRAIMPAPPVPKTAPVRPRPAVSLDAYLQRRGGKP